MNKVVVPVHVDWRNRKAVWCLHAAARCTVYLYT